MKEMTKTLLKILITVFILEYAIMLLFSIPFIEDNIPKQLLDFLDPLILSTVGFFPLWFWIIKPIDELKNEAFIKLLQNSKMTSLGEMAGGIAHEINNPLAIIIGKIEILLNSKNKSEEYRIESYIKIEQSVKKIAKIIQNLRQFAGSHENEQQRTIKLYDLIQDTLAFASEKIINSDIVVHIDCDENIEFSCQAFQMLQALLNLVLNSTDAIREENEKWIKIEVQNKNDMILIAIIDSGIGISTDIQTKMMQPFYSTKCFSQSKGLGLSVAKGIIEKHKGKLIYDTSSLNTKFIIELPKYVKKEIQTQSAKDDQRITREQFSN